MTMTVVTAPVTTSTLYHFTRAWSGLAERSGQTPACHATTRSFCRMLSMDEALQTIGKILDGFRQNHTDLFPAVELLRTSYEQLPARHRSGFFKILAARLQSEPISFPSPADFDRSSHVLIIRAWAAFGPADALPKILFSLLKPDTREAMEGWASMIGTELHMSLGSFGDRFSAAALSTIKAECALITSDRSIGLSDSRVPAALVDVSKRLENLVKKIEFERNVVQKLRPQLKPAGPAAPQRDATQEVKMDVKVHSWRDVHYEFKSLANEQRGMPENERLSLYRDRNSRTGDPGPFSDFFGKPPEMGPWTISKGPNRLFRKKFEALATRAGAKLGPPRGSPLNIPLPPEPSSFWADCLYEHLLGKASPQLSETDHGREVMKDVCESAAEYCAWLEANAQETAASGDLRNTARTNLQASPASVSESPSCTLKPKRLSATITCPNAARRMEAYLESKGMSQTTFANQVGTTDRTLRSFRQTGKVRRDIFDSIAKIMNIPKEELLKPK